MEDYSISPEVVSEYSVAPPAGTDGGLQHLPGGLSVSIVWLHRRALMEDYSISPEVVSEYSVAPPAGTDGGLQHLPGGCQ